MQMASLVFVSKALCLCVKLKHRIISEIKVFSVLKMSLCMFLFYHLLSPPPHHPKYNKLSMQISFFLCFTNSRCPIQTKLVDVTLLSEAEKVWLNKYHVEIWEKVSPLLDDEPRALEWLKRECAPL